jgi:hypothetical protein
MDGWPIPCASGTIPRTHARSRCSRARCLSLPRKAGESGAWRAVHGRAAAVRVPLERRGGSEPRSGVDEVADCWTGIPWHGGRGDADSDADERSRRSESARRVLDAVLTAERHGYVCHCSASSAGSRAVRVRRVRRAPIRGGATNRGCTHGDARSPAIPSPRCARSVVPPGLLSYKDAPLPSAGAPPLQRWGRRIARGLVSSMAKAVGRPLGHPSGTPIIQGRPVTQR